MTTTLSGNASTRLDAAALSHLADFWTTRAVRHPGDDGNPNAAWEAAYAAGFVGDATDVKPHLPSLSAYTAFSIGFATAMKIAAAVIADPFGDPMSAIRGAVDDARVEVDECVQAACPRGSDA